MEGLNSFEKEYCIKVTNAIFDMPISQDFREFVDDKNSAYYSKIKNPMCLREVLRKLTENKYAKVQDWKDDMNLIWQNAFKFNKNIQGWGNRQKFIYTFAKELSNRFKEMSENIPSTRFQEWVLNLEEKQKKLSRILNLPPNVYIPHYIPEPKQAISRSKSSKNL
ncbi:Bromodomain containing protein [Trichomonas vaginalis G3]|uniref:Bromodomain containing protein n=1 Tax=Trichomonas vaginalis (strain ATCC PRA-98 / G3) TaxID=412133 RepID=A2DF86_TRIV3|nr:bromodomain family [Trichomonas vaginalis G3]EAY20814.1 Bromodomain containing protein [Trichomonas vaginalis G3]KAI5521578.1 bromodomain family [Trichomonas vaginalis G3]|eukprot:XP_001581800.1 Bromodomain containing protein [Trichomonas vaginalis G3]